jgi:hypothetical protein
MSYHVSLQADEQIKEDTSAELTNLYAAHQIWGSASQAITHYFTRRALVAHLS